MLEPKPINKEAVPAALEKALRYRLLNEPGEAESICRDVLAADADNQNAYITLVLALTDQFVERQVDAFDGARQVIPNLRSEYSRAYYEGIVLERWAKAQLGRGSGESAYNWVREALRCFERAESLSKTDDPEAILRWNACVRLLNERAQTDSTSDSMTFDVAAGFGDDTATR